MLVISVILFLFKSLGGYDLPNYIVVFTYGSLAESNGTWHICSCKLQHRFFWGGYKCFIFVQCYTHVVIYLVEPLSVFECCLLFVEYISTCVNVLLCGPCYAQRIVTLCVKMWSSLNLLLFVYCFKNMKFLCLRLHFFCFIIKAALAPAFVSYKL